MAIVIKNKGQSAPLAKASTHDKGTDYLTHLQSKSAMGKVVVEKKHAGESEPHKVSETDIPVHKGVVSTGCKVGCSGSRTLNLGNYENIKISVWLEMPCSVEDIEQTYDYVSSWVGDQLTTAVNQTKD